MIPLTTINIDKLKNEIPKEDYREFKKSFHGVLFSIDFSKDHHDEIIDLEVTLRKGKRIGFFKE